jgi:hypothetical protein
MRKVLLSLSFMSLVGCVVLDEMGQPVEPDVRSQPRFAYVVDVATPFTPQDRPNIYSAFLAPDDRAVPIAMLHELRPDDEIYDISLSPGARYLGVNMSESFGQESEDFFDVMDMLGRGNIAHETDNTLSDDVMRMCTTSPELIWAQEHWPELVEEGTVRPDSQPVLRYLFEEPYNTARFAGWLDDQSFVARVQVTAAIFEGVNGQILHSELWYYEADLRLTARETAPGQWDYVSCTTPTQPIFTGQPVRNLTINTTTPGDSNLLYLDGRMLLGVGEGAGPLSPHKVDMLAGPFLPK